MWLGRLLWKGGDGWLIDGFGPDGVSARVIDVTRNVVRLQTGYLYHYAFAMLIGVAALHHLVHVLGGRPLMASWPLLSVTTFLPLVGALLIVFMRDEDASVARNARWIALWTTLITFAISLILVWRFDPSSAEFQFVEKQAVARRHHQLPHGRRRHLAAVRHPHHRADAALHHRELGADRAAA